MRRKVAPVHAMKAYGGVQIYCHLFLTSALKGGKWSASGPGCLTRNMYSVTNFPRVVHLYTYRINQITPINRQTNLVYIHEGHLESKERFAI